MQLLALGVAALALALLVAAFSNIFKGRIATAVVLFVLAIAIGGGAAGLAAA